MKTCFAHSLLAKSKPSRDSTGKGWPQAKSKASLLIVAMLLSAIIALSLGTYVNLSLNSLKLANRTFYNNAAMNLAETGAEEPLWCFNQVTAGVAVATAWAGWTITPNGTDGTATRTFTDFTLAANTTGSVKVYVDHYNPTGSVEPKVIALATITIPNGGATLGKEIEVTLQRRSLFATGLVAKESISFSGNNATVDSWNSLYNDDGTARSSPVDYSTDVDHDGGSIGSVSVTSTISVDNADIWGTAAVGGSSTDAIDVGHNGRVGPYGTAAGLKDPNSVTTDFTANMDPVAMPTGGTVITSIGSSVGTTGTTTVLSFNGNINGSLTVNGNVTLYLTTDSTNFAIQLTGNDGITLATGATLTIYTAGKVKIAGNGLANPGLPSSFQLYGTSTSSVAQDIEIKGNGALSGIVYAPNAAVTINGNGDVKGSVIGKTISLTGNAAFHYDESLADLGGNNPYGVTRWRELASESDRNTYASVMSGW